MSRRGDESDEEVYLSDPSDDDASSEDGYDFSSDAPTTSGHAAAAEVDWTLHDEEAARASEPTPRQTVKAEEPQKAATTVTEKKTMNPNAAPWVPPTSKPQQQQAEEPKQQPAFQGESSGPSVDPTPKSSTPPSATATTLPATAPPATPPLNKNGHKESPDSPIDVSKMMERVIAANSPPADTGTALPKEEPAPAPQAAPQKEEEQATAPEATPSAPTPVQPAPSATPTPPQTAASQGGIGALDDLEPLPADETEAAEAPSAKTEKPAVLTPESKEAEKEVDGKPSATTAKDASPAVGAAELPKTEAAVPQFTTISKEGDLDAKPGAATAKEDSPAVVSAEVAKPEAAAPPPKVEQADEVKGEEASVPVASGKSDDVDAAISSKEEEQEAAPVPRSAEEPVTEPKPTESKPEASSSSQQSAEPQRSAGMPSLPERKKKGAAMPSLPPRTTRRQEQPAEPSNASAPAPPQPPASQPQNPPPAPANPAPPAPTPAPTPAAPSPPASTGAGAQRQGNPILVQRAPPPAAAPAEEESPEVQRKRAQLRDLRIAMQRCAKRLGLSDHALIRQVKYRLEHAERVRLGRTSGVEEIPATADALEAENPQEQLLQITAMVIGVSGSGKSATINSLLGYEAVSADAFNGTKNITTVNGEAFGIQLKLVDTPGLHAAGGSYRENAKLIEKINKARGKCKPDLIIYCDRMDILPTDGSHIPLIRQITEVMGSEMWFNTLALMTHATAEGPSNPGDPPLPYSHFSPLRQQIFQRTLQQAIGDQRMNSPTAFVENRATCPKNREGEAVLPDGLAWRKFVLLYMAVMKTLSKADECMETGQADTRKTAAQSSAMSQLQMMLMQQRGGGNKLPPLPFLVTNMIKHAGPKQYPEVEREIKRPDEIKAIKNFSNRRREARKRINYLKAKHIEKRLMAIPNSGYEAEEDPTEQPSMAPALPPTFDIDDTSHLYRAYEPNPNNPGWITRMRLEQNVVDHTDGVESLTTERSFVKRAPDQHLGGVPCQVHAIIEKGKNSQMFQGGAEASFYQNWRTIHTGRAQLLTMSGNDVLYISQLDTHLAATKDNHLTLGGLVSLLGEDGLKPAKDRIALGVKLEDEMELPTIKWKNYRHSAKAGLGQAQVTFRGRKEKALGANGEYTLIAGKKEEHQLVASYSQMTYRGNSQKQYGLSAALPLSAETTASPKLQLQSGGQGSFSLTLTSHDHPSIGLTALIPLAKAVWDSFRRRRAGEVEGGY